MVRFVNPRRHPPFHMHDMIRAQPKFVGGTIHRLRMQSARSFLGSAVHIVATGCGTSFHAAQYGARILAVAIGPPARVEAIQAYDLLHGPRVDSKTVVLGVSHSGNTSTTNRAMSRAARAGATVLGICGLADTSLAEIADRTLVIGETQDRSWANTMSYTTQLTAFACLASDLGGPAWRGVGRDLTRLPALLRKALSCEPAVRRLSRKVAARKRVTFLGSGLDEITALEAALKIRETCSLTASGYHIEQFLHGPFLSLDRGDAIVALRSREDGGRADAILDGLARAGASVTTIGDGHGARIPLPTIHPVLRPIIGVVPLQFLAYYAALERGVNPDIMRSDVARYRPALEVLFS